MLYSYCPVSRFVTINLSKLRVTFVSSSGVHISGFFCTFRSEIQRKPVLFNCGLAMWHRP